jgi:nitroreductase/putative intracellular protease/amidase/ketosteroid isomerase-like protein
MRSLLWKARQPAAVLIGLLLPTLVGADGVWWEETGKTYGYELSAYRILVVVGDDFDYREATIIRDHWRRWGAAVEVAGTDAEVVGHVCKRTPQGWDRSQRAALRTDRLLPDVELARYQVLFFPGGGGPASLLEHAKKEMVALVQEADRRCMVLAASGQGPLVLAAAGVVHGRRVTAHSDVTAAVREAGGEYVGATSVVDGNLVTSNWPYFETTAVAVAEKLLYPCGGGPSEHSPFVTDPVLRAIKDRRSVRRFTSEDVDEKTVDLLLRAAAWAPSANNDQPWRFVVIRKAETKRAIVDALMKRLQPLYEQRGISLDRMAAFWSASFAAPVHIAAFVDPRGVEVDRGFEEIQELWNVEGVSTACQNILLAAHSLGLGAVWVGATVTVEGRIKELLGAPEGARLVTVVAVGHPAEQPLPPVRKALPGVVSLEHWHDERPPAVEPTITGEPAKEPERAATSARLEEAFRAYVKVVQSSDLEGLMAMVGDCESFVFLTADGRRIDGCDGYRDFHRKWFAETGWEMPVELLAVHEGRDYGHTVARFHFKSPAPDGRTYHLESFFTLVFRRHDGHWRVVSDVCTPIRRYLTAGGVEYSLEQENVLQVLKTRRTVRSFRPDAIPDEHLKSILEAARFAPTAGNQQPWTFLVIRDRAKLDRLQRDALEWYLERQKAGAGQGPAAEDASLRQTLSEILAHVLSAPVYVAVLVDSAAPYPEWITYDGTLAVANLMTAARALGYGTGFFTTFFPEERMRTFFGIPERYRLICFTPIGVPVEWPEPPPKKGLEEMVVYEGFPLQQ